MMKYGCEEKWSPKACQLKYAELMPLERDEAPEIPSPTL